jgi:hypothetical protein
MSACPPVVKNRRGLSLEKQTLLGRIAAKIALFELLRSGSAPCAVGQCT